MKALRAKQQLKRHPRPLPVSPSSTEEPPKSEEPAGQIETTTFGNFVLHGAHVVNLCGNTGGINSYARKQSAGK